MCYVNDVTGYEQEGKCSIPGRVLISSSPLDRRLSDLSTELSQRCLLRDRRHFNVIQRSAAQIFI
jgi:hypothetical protein